MKTIKPLAIRGAKAIGKTALNTGMDVLSDVLRGAPIGQSIKRRAVEGRQTLIAKARKTMAPPGQPNRTKGAREPIKRGPAGGKVIRAVTRRAGNIQKDIFS